MVIERDGDRMMKDALSLRSFLIIYVVAYSVYNLFCDIINPSDNCT